MKTFLFIVLKIVIILLLAFWSVIAIMAFFEVPMLFWTTVILYGLIIYLWIFYKKIKSLPILSKNAKVISKTRGPANFHITFEFADGTRKTLRTTVQSYGSMLEGENGTLFYKEYKKFVRFIDFQRNNA